MKNFCDMTDTELADAVVEGICELGSRGRTAGAKLDVEGEQQGTFLEGMEWLNALEVKD